MNTSLFKIDWERASETFFIKDDELLALLAPFTQEPIQSCFLMGSGCANANYKVIFRSGLTVLLRIYLRDQFALSREIQIHQLVQDKIPIPKIHYTDSSFKNLAYPYAIMEWVEGELMRDVIVKGSTTDIVECAFSAGKLLNQLRHIPFQQAGFFNPDLSIQPFSADHTLDALFNLCCNEPIIAHYLGDSLLQALADYIKEHAFLLLDQTKANLTHADFDPSNILVKKHNDTYQIAALLDWEFALADSYLLDMGLFLRYSHRLPRIYQDSFIQGIEDKAESLPAHWQTRIKLKELICLLSLLYDNRHQTRPNMKKDVKRLLEDIVIV
ncbi:phosphotransferase [Candidatus Berkiella aquae]|uniref:Aminoglycoside phosphotransferase family protein n=1 Tax=Candidatus Berkiella aquae TaxID=295108 RepID=A0A0Q9YTT9_9GAMM|nr:aminoglycoside phosphotransferase family protein [Candidatus Berkiella aquae]MCS5709852.1 aminoglycoside phosphotransferase family protein [Candidatus Berkiella aquae]